MKCVDVREQLIETNASAELASTGAQQHLAACAACAAEWKEFAATMALLDEWKAPEPNPYFATRLRARLREEAAQPASFTAKLRVFVLGGRKAALASAMAVLLFGSVMMFRTGSGSNEERSLHNDAITAAKTEVGTPVGDLEAVDKNFDMYANFDLLDDVTPSAGVSD